MTVKSRLTAAEFDEIAALPENADKRLEFIGGEIVELVSNNYSSLIAGNIIGEVKAFCKGKGLGYVTVPDGGYMVSGERYIPDMGFISKRRQPKPSHETYNSNAPDLAVEVVSPTDGAKDILDKVANYLAAGTQVWVIFPTEQQIKVYKPGQPVKTIDIEGTLDGGDVLPGLSIKASDVFAED